jgi:hypothetical protein
VAPSRFMARRQERRPASDSSSFTTPAPLRCRGEAGGRGGRTAGRWGRRTAGQAESRTQWWVAQGTQRWV